MPKLELQHIDVDIHDGVATVDFNKDMEIPCFTSALLDDFLVARDWINGKDSVRFQVTRSLHPKVFSLGGDLQLIRDCAKYQLKTALTQYAVKCIDLQYYLVQQRQQPLTTIALVKGPCLGGAFELALGHKVLVAEKQATFQFPEVMNGMFPGMGAQSILTRKVGPINMSKILGSALLTPAEDLTDVGIVNYCAKEGYGQSVVDGVINSMHRGEQYMLQAYGYVNPISYSELSAISQMWVNCVLDLKPENITRLEWLINAQHRMYGS